MTTADRLWALVLRDDDGVAARGRRTARVVDPDRPGCCGWPVPRAATAPGCSPSTTTPAAALAEALLARLHDRPTQVTVSLGPLPVLDPVVERLCMALQDWSIDGSAEVPVVRRSGPPEATEYLTPSVRRTLRKVSNRLRTDGVDSQVAFTRERHRIIAAAAGHGARLPRPRRGARRRRGRLRRRAPGAGLAAVRRPDRALAGQAGLEVATLTFDGQLAAYVVGFDDGHAYRVMDGRFVSCLGPLLPRPAARDRGAAADDRRPVQARRSTG